MSASVPVSKAGLISVAGGNNAPSPTLGPYIMTPFADDLRPANLDCSYVVSPLGGDVVLNIPMLHNEVPETWSTWSNSYKGDVYWTGQDNYFAALTMPSNTCAFYFYGQPNNINVHTISASAYDGVSERCKITQEVQGNAGACYYGFYGTEGSVITSIMVNCSTDDFAIGEFGIAILPAPEAFVLSNIGLSVVFGLRRLCIL